MRCLSRTGSGDTRQRTQCKGGALATKAVETQGEGGALAAKAVETQGRGGAVGAKSVGAQGEGGGLAGKAVEAQDEGSISRDRPAVSTAAVVALSAMTAILKRPTICHESADDQQKGRNSASEPWRHRGSFCSHGSVGCLNCGATKVVCGTKRHICAAGPP